jgi:hypothetical protein
VAASRAVFEGENGVLGGFFDRKMVFFDRKMVFLRYFDIKMVGFDKKMGVFDRKMAFLRYF